MPISAEDRGAIQDLHHQYYISTEEKDVAGFMNCWAEDRPVRFESPFGIYDDRASLEAFEDEHVNRGMAIGKRHANLNLVLKEGPDADTVLATSYMLVMEVDDVPAIVATGIYRDSIVVRTSLGWRFVYRNLDLDDGFQKLMARQAPAVAA